MPRNTKHTALAKPYSRKRGNVTFIISSFTNPNTTKTPQELILQMLESRVEAEREETEQHD